MLDFLRVNKMVLILWILLLLLVVVLFLLFYAGAHEFLYKQESIEMSSDLKDEFIEIDGLDIHYYELGDPKSQPQIIFLHGWGGFWADKWLGQILTALNSHGYYAVAYEHPGMGLSDIPNEAWDNSRYAEFAASFIERKGLEKPIIVGQSFGGGVAATFARKYPDKLSHLILVDANTRDKAWFYASMVKLLGNSFTKTLNSNWVPFKIKQVFAEPMLIKPKLKLTEDSISKIDIMGNSLILTHTENQLEKLREITVPVTFVWGEYDTKIPVSQAKLMQEQVPSSKLLLLKGGHTVIYKRPQATVDLIVSSLTE